ncbi:hypothetical protein HBI74_023060 [Parastagonospora nodorum]|nr:hypothetical protein HBI74_023060 [Parastagonospora nodorum]
MIDLCTCPVSNGAQGDAQHMEGANASQKAKQEVTPCTTDASLSSMCSLASPSSTASSQKHNHSRPTVVFSSRHLRPLAMATERNESGNHTQVVQHRQLTRGTKAPKLYTCNQCTKGYAHAKNLREHKAKHRNKRYSCEICGESVADKRNLPRHKRLRHSTRGRLTAAPTEQTTIDTEERSREETVKEKPTQDECNTGGNCFI